MRGTFRSPRLRLAFATGFAFACHAVIPLLAQAQGVTGAVVQGSVVGVGGAPMGGAVVTLVNTGTGSLLRVTTRPGGVYLFDNVPVGGPYRLEARLIGFAPASVEGITLHLGDRLSRDLVLGSTPARELEGVLVRGSTLRDAGAGGPAYSISGQAVRTLPLINRDFVGLLSMVPQATGSSALSISGQHPRFNAIQVDGASSNDFFGTQITPGANVGEKIISLEALEELRVLVAPFDVRQGGFSGGLINGVTRSGTNELRGSVFSSISRAALVGADTSGASAGDFDITQYGMTVGGPIVRDRLHFFAVTDLQSSRTAFIGPIAGDPATGISEDAARRAAQIFHDRYGFDSGGPEAPTLRNPNSNVFLKVSWQPSRNQLIDLTQTWAGGRTDVFTRAITGRDGWQLSNSGSVALSNTVITRARATSAFGAFTNELIASFSKSASRFRSNNRVPVFLVQGDLGSTLLAGGSARGAQDVNTDQRVFEVTDNSSWVDGRHQLTIGTQNQLIRFHDNFFLGPWGVWTFASVDALDRREPIRYEVALPLGEKGPVADYPATLIAGYAQDRWTATQHLTLTTGLRIDVPFMRPPKRNPLLASKAALGNIDTGVFPSGNAVLSPRVGFAWEIGKHHDSMIRGGIGGFAGRPPFAWLTGAYVNTGQEQTVLICGSAQGVPAPTTDIAHLPSRCAGNQPSLPLPTVNYVVPDFRFQQAIKYALGVDHEFGEGLTTSLDVIHTRTRNTLVVGDINLVEQGLDAEGRMMYGTSRTASIHSTRLDSTSFGPVFRYQNRSADRSTAVTATLQKRWESQAVIDLGYSWSSTTDVMSLSGNTATVMFMSNPIDGTIARRELRRSARDIPHNFVATAIVPARFGITASVFFRARSGTPYAYAVSGDANADSVATNDLVYVPRDSADITLTNPKGYRALDAFIESEPCLRAQRGRVMTRNSCRNPAVTSLDGRLAKTLTVGRRTVELNADLFNLPNMLSRRWGLVRETSSAETKRGILTVSSAAGWDPVANRPRYSVPTIGGEAIMPSRNTVVIDASRWRMQIGARYSF